MELTAILNKKTLYPLQYAWEVVYESVGPSADSATKKKAEDYFATFKNYSTIATITLDNKYLIRESVLSAKVLVQRLGGSAKVLEAIAKITVLGSLAWARFTRKGEAAQELEGGSKNTLPLEICNKRCQKSRRLLQGEEDTIPFELKILVYSGPTRDTTTQRGPTEQKIEGVLQSTFQEFNTLSVSLAQGFVYFMYYKVVTEVKDMQTGKVT